LRLRTQLVRFAAVGALSALVDFGVLWALMRFGFGYVAAKAVSFVAGTTTAYLLNRRWTFQADGSKRRFLAVMALYGLTFAVQVGIFAVGYPWALSLGRGQLFAQAATFVVAQGTATCVNFAVQRAVIFR
jgi:putative flippase GtrA